MVLDGGPLATATGVWLNWCWWAWRWRHWFALIIDNAASLILDGDPIAVSTSFRSSWGSGAWTWSWVSNWDTFEVDYATVGILDGFPCAPVVVWWLGRCWRAKWPCWILPTLLCKWISIRPKLTTIGIALPVWRTLSLGVSNNSH